MTPSRRTAMLRDNDHYLLRDLLERLAPLLERALPPSTSTKDGVNPATADAIDGVVDKPAALRCGHLDECLVLMTNVMFARPCQRLTLLTYYFQVVRPAETLTVEEMSTLPSIFSTVASIPAHERMAATDAIVSRCAVHRPPYGTVMALLPFVRDPTAYAASHVQLTPASVEAMAGAEALQILHLSGPHLPTLITHALVKVCMSHLVSSSPGAHKRVPLTPSVATLAETLLRFAHGDTQKPTDGAAGGGTRPSAGEEEVEEEGDEEDTRVFSEALLSLVSAVDWESGLVLGDDSAAPATTKQQRQQQYLHLLECIVRVQEWAATMQTEVTDLRWPSGEVFVQRYVVPVVTPSAPPQRDTLSLLASVSRAPWLDEASQRSVLEKAIAVCGVSSASALARFIELLARDAVRLQVHDPSLTRLVLKQRTLDPHVQIFSSHLTTLSGAAYGQQYVTNVLTLCQYASQQAELLTPERVELVRSAAVSWIYRCLLSLASQARRTPLMDGGVGEQNSESPHHHGSPVQQEAQEADPNVALGISTAAFEQLLTYAAHFGCKPAPSLQQLLTLRVSQQEESQSQWLLLQRYRKVHDVVSVTNDDMLEMPLTAAPLDGALLLLPAHFVFAVRLDVSWPLALTAGYLKAVLTCCDLAIFPLVVTSFLAALKSRRDLPDLAVDLFVANEALRTLIQRAEQRQSSSPLVSVSEVVESLLLTDVSTITRDVIRCVLGHLHRTRMYEAPLRALRLQAAPATGCGFVAADNAALEDDDAEDTEGETRGEAVEPARDHDSRATADALLPEENSQDVGAEIDQESVALDSVLVERHLATSRALCDAVGLLAPAQLREVALGNMDRLWDFFPAAAQEVFQRIEPQLGGMGPRDLFLLAVRYPPAEESVTKQLSLCDMRVHVDFGVFLRFAKSLPMVVVMAVADAHLATLSFAWTARLASSLSTRAERVPTPFLAQILSRLEELADKATDADRNLVLVILQHFTPSVPALPPPTAEGSEDHIVAPPVASRGGNDDPDDDRTRLERVRQCCDKLLLLDSVRDMASLEVFLNTYPATLRSMVQVSVVAQVQRHLVEPLLKKPLTAQTLSDLAAVARVLHQHELLVVSTARRLYRRVFVSPLVPDADARAVALPLRPLLELAVFVGSAKLPDGAVSTNAQRCGSAALKLAVNRSVSVVQRVDALGTITDLLGGQTHPPRGVLWIDADVLRGLCLDALGECAALSAQAFATLVQAVSRLRLWKHVTVPPGTSDAGGPDARVLAFHRQFPPAFARADPHNRCVVLKALSSDPDLFHRHEQATMRFLQQDIPILSHEDLELLLSAILLVRKGDVAEAALDAISTRLLPVVDQCRRSTLVRVMQCHAQFGVRDDALFKAVLMTLEEQCAKELRLDVQQIVTLLQAVVALQLEAPEKVIVSCFQQLEKAADGLSLQQQALAAELLVDLDVAYAPYVHTLVVKVLENREGSRHSARLRAAAERLCDAYDVEMPPHLRIPRLRKRREKRRLQLYAEQRRTVC